MRGTDPTSYPQINHRLAIFNEDGEIHDVYSQSDLVRFIYHKSEALGPLGECTLSELGIAVCPPPGVASVGSATLTVEAFMAMRKAKVSSLAVVDKEGLLARGGPRGAPRMGPAGGQTLRGGPLGRWPRAVPGRGRDAGRRHRSEAYFSPVFRWVASPPATCEAWWSRTSRSVPAVRCPLSAVRCPLPAA